MSELGEQDHSQLVRSIGEEFLRENVCKTAKLLFITAVGSTLYNLKDENKSDFDYLVIYMIPSQQLLSLPSLSIEEPPLTYYDINSMGSAKTRVLGLSERGICTTTKDGHDISCFGKFDMVLLIH